MSMPRMIRLATFATFILAFLIYMHLQALLFFVGLSSSCTGGEENYPISLGIFEAVAAGLSVCLLLIVANLGAIYLIRRSQDRTRAIIGLSTVLNLFIAVEELSDFRLEWEAIFIQRLFNNSFLNDGVWVLPTLAAQLVGVVAAVGLIGTTFIYIWRPMMARQFQGV